MMRLESRFVDSVSGVGVLDKAMVVLAAVEVGPLSLAQLVDRTGLYSATAHRLAAALEAHGLVRRGEGGRFCPGLTVGIAARWERGIRAGRCRWARGP